MLCQEHGSLSLLEKVRSLACKAWKMLRQLGLRIKSPAPLLDGAVPKKQFGAVPRGHVDGAAGIWDARQFGSTEMGWTMHLAAGAGNS